MQKFEITDEMAEKIIRRQGRLHAYEKLDPGATAFVVIDMQNYFMADGEPACCPPAREIVPNVNRLADVTRTTGGLVVWVQTEAKPETPEVWANRYEMFRPDLAESRQISLGKGGSGFPLWHELEACESDTFVIKTHYSAIIEGSSNLEEVLRQKSINTVLIGGVATNVCCESTARDCMMRGFRTIMVSDSNAASTEEKHAHCLANFISRFGDVQTTAEVIEGLTENVKENQTAAE